jgi:hypothetical protein
MVGEEMTERERNGSENFSKSSERVRVLLYCIQSFINIIFQENAHSPRRQRRTFSHS